MAAVVVYQSPEASNMHVCFRYAVRTFLNLVDNEVVRSGNNPFLVAVCHLLHEWGEEFSRGCPAYKLDWFCAHVDFFTDAVHMLSGCRCADAGFVCLCEALFSGLQDWNLHQGGHDSGTGLQSARQLCRCLAKVCRSYEKKGKIPGDMEMDAFREVVASLEAFGKSRKV